MNPSQVGEMLDDLLTRVETQAAAGPRAVLLGASAAVAVMIGGVAVFVLTLVVLVELFA